MKIYEALDLFREFRADFAAKWGWLRSARFVVSKRTTAPDTKGCKRNLAWADTENMRVFLLRRALSLPQAKIEGLILHELGHLVDPLASEQEADDWAEIATGLRVSYDRDGIQTTGRGRHPRPKGLK